MHQKCWGGALECSYIYPSITAHSLHHCPNVADQWRVILKAERLDYINASFVNVGIKHMYIQNVPSIIKIIPSCSIMILWHLYAGLQAVQRVHCYTGPYEEHLSRLLEDGVWEGVWVDCDAVRPGREWRGDLNMMGLMHELQNCVASIPSNICSDAPTFTFSENAYIDVHLCHYFINHIQIVQFVLKRKLLVS